MTPLPPGTRIGNIELGQIISDSGGVSLVYEGRAASGGLFDLAVKEGKPFDSGMRQGASVIASDQRRQVFNWVKARMVEEAEFLQSGTVSHPCLVKMHGVVRANNTVYMVMERLETSLAALVKSSGPQSSQLMLRWLMPVLDALVACENVGCHHLDLAPGNIMFRTDGSPVIVDFGFAKLPNKPRSRSTKFTVTPAYSAPEKGTLVSRDLDARTDVYSLAAVANYALTGVDPVDFNERAAFPKRPPLTKDDLALRTRAAGPELSKVLDKAASYAKTERYVTIAALREAIRNAVPTAAPKAMPGTPVEAGPQIHRAPVVEPRSNPEGKTPKTGPKPGPDTVRQRILLIAIILMLMLLGVMLIP